MGPTHMSVWWRRGRGDVGPALEMAQLQTGSLCQGAPLEPCRGAGGGGHDRDVIRGRDGKHHGFGTAGLPVDQQHLNRGQLTPQLDLVPLLSRLSLDRR